MYKILLAAGAAALAFAAPASADPGKGKGHGNQARHGQTVSKGHGKHGKIFQGHVAANFWGNRSCPPGLAKKDNGCLPPGIAKQRFNLGDRWNGNYGLWNYNQVPLDWRSQYGLDPANRYYYRDGYLYSVDPRTRLVESVIQALIH
jgi:opacity protein-like surface antigen